MHMMWAGRRARDVAPHITCSPWMIRSVGPPIRTPNGPSLLRSLNGSLRTCKKVQRQVAATSSPALPLRGTGSFVTDAQCATAYSSAAQVLLDWTPGSGHPTGRCISPAHSLLDPCVPACRMPGAPRNHVRPCKQPRTVMKL